MGFRKRYGRHFFFFLYAWTFTRQRIWYRYISRSIEEEKRRKTNFFTAFVHEFLFQSCANSSISRLNCMKTTSTFIELLRNGRWLSTDRIRINFDALVCWLIEKYTGCSMIHKLVFMGVDLVWKRNEKSLNKLSYTSLTSLQRFAVIRSINIVDWKQLSLIPFNL